MGMYLANKSVYTILLTGTTVVQCISLQHTKTGTIVREFTSEISSLVLVNHDYFTIPDDQAGVEDA